MKIISYQELAFNEDMQVQKGMNFNVKKSYSIVLMGYGSNGLWLI